MAFAREKQARLPLAPPNRAGVPNDAAGFTSCCGPVSCSPPDRGFVAPLRPPGSHPASGAALPRTLASPRTGLTPAGCRELVARLRHDAILSVMAPELLDALPAGTYVTHGRLSGTPAGGWRCGWSSFLIVPQTWRSTSRNEVASPSWWCDASTNKVTVRS
jgi:hypothetical protein